MVDRTVHPVGAGGAGGADRAADRTFWLGEKPCAGRAVNVAGRDAGRDADGNLNPIRTGSGISIAYPVAKPYINCPIGGLAYIDSSSYPTVTSNANGNAVRQESHADTHSYSASTAFIAYPKWENAR